ncbi:glycosyltransferase family 2 protein [Flavobacteriales bacterium]|nr:glycosyltransferase family 2 protein [Flavobacteriales bacterium]
MLEDALTIIIPVYNEEESLGVQLPKLVEYCQTKGHRITLVDDGSSDGSWERISSYIDKEGVNGLRHKVNKGYGGAIKTGILTVKTKYCITIDADGQHQLEDVGKLYEKIRRIDADMVIGRRIAGKEGLYRKIGKGLILNFAKILMSIRIKDLNSGMKIYNSELAKRYIKLCPDSMAFSDVIALVFINQKHLVVEEPIRVNPRLSGESTINTRTAIETIAEILNIVVLFNPMKVFLPIAIISLLFGLGWGLPFLITGKGLSVAAMFAMVTGILFFFLGLLAEQLSLIRKSKI